LYQISNSLLIFLSLVSVFITHGGKFNTAVAPARFNVRQDSEVEKYLSIYLIKSIILKKS
jgi:hypothetical protein